MSVVTTSQARVESRGPSVSGVLKRYGAEYLKEFGHRVTAQQKKVLRAVMACREDTLGTISYACTGCGHRHTVPRSCCNRHCAGCQHDAVQTWLEKQQAKQLPCNYFMITFTVPRELRSACLRNPEVAYRAIMSCCSEALKIGAANERFVGAAKTGFTGVLHTWGRDLGYHPHAHFIVPAGGLDNQGQWVNSRSSLFVPEQVLAHRFRELMKDRLKDEAGFESVPSSVWVRRWVVDSTGVGDGKRALEYLAPYVARGAVGNWRVTQCDGFPFKESEVQQSLAEVKLTLQVKPSGSSAYRPMPLSVAEFIRRWLLHVLPQGLHRVRHYGLMHSASGHDFEELRWKVAAATMRLYLFACTQIIVMAELPKMRCPHCGGVMISMGYSPPADDRRLAWWPSAGSVDEVLLVSSDRAPP